MGLSMRREQIWSNAENTSLPQAVFGEKRNKKFFKKV